jgi:hypothetical protein
VNWNSPRGPAATEPTGNWCQSIFRNQNSLITFTTTYPAANPQDSRPAYLSGLNDFKIDFDYLPSAEGGYLSQIQNKYGATTVSLFDYSYDSMGRIKTWTRNQPHGNPIRFMDFVYDLAGQLDLADRKDNRASGPLQERITYGYDQAGNRTVKVVGGQPTVADFNERNRLVSGDYHGTVPLLGLLNDWAQ